MAIWYNLVITHKGEPDAEAEVHAMLEKSGYDMALIERTDSPNRLLVKVPGNPRVAVVNVINVVRSEGSDFLERYRLTPIVHDFRYFSLADVQP